MSNYADYAKIVEKVKAEAREARAAGKPWTGAQVHHKIAKLWAKFKGREFTEPDPAPLDKELLGLGPDPKDRDPSPSKAKTTGVPGPVGTAEERGINLPGEEFKHPAVSKKG